MLTQKVTAQRKEREEAAAKEAKESAAREAALKVIWILTFMSDRLLMVT